MLKEIEKIRQQSAYNGVHKDGPEYRARIEAATKEYMPLCVSTISIDITQPAIFPIYFFGLRWSFTAISVVLPYVCSPPVFLLHVLILHFLPWKL